MPKLKLSSATMTFLPVVLSWESWPACKAKDLSWLAQVKQDEESASGSATPVDVTVRKQVATDFAERDAPAMWPHLLDHLANHHCFLTPTITTNQVSSRLDLSLTCCSPFSTTCNPTVQRRTPSTPAPPIPRICSTTVRRARPPGSSALSLYNL